MWIQKAKGTPIAVAAERLKLSIRKGRSLSPCPACGEQNRGSGDKRGPVGGNTSDTAWRCHVCGKRGDVVDLVSYAISGGKLRDINKDKQRKVYAWFEGTGFSEKYKDFKPKITKPKRPEVSEVASLWRAAKPLNQMNCCKEDVMVSGFLKERKFDIDLLAQTGIVKALPTRTQYQWPAWWPSIWSPVWRLATPAFEITGKVASLHARAVVQSKSSPKSRWPKGCEASGLLLGNQTGIRLLRGTLEEEIEALLICEGITDLFRASSAAIHERMNVAVLSGTSGSFAKLSSARIPEGLSVIVCTDPDEAGDNYAKDIFKSLSPRPIFRMKLEK